MAKGSKSNKTDNQSGKAKSHEKTAFQSRSHSKRGLASSDDYLISMSAAPKVGDTTHWFQMLPVLVYTTIVIMIVRLASYSRPMDQFYFWTVNGKNDQVEFFSYYKMSLIVVCAILALVLVLYKVFAQSFYIKRSYAYIPMIVYTAFVLLSYIASDYKEFALWGWNERFEGTVTLIAYMVMLFYTINIVNSEQNVKWIIRLLVIVSTILGLLGITQAANNDFFRTVIGKKLITPSSFWNNLDSLNFTFTNQIYQTVYNINYVSFYLTLLIPIFGILFIRSVMHGNEEPLYKKIGWAALFSLVIFNLIGSASSGGLMGMAIVVLVAIIVLNKNIIKWWKPVAILLILTIIVAGASYSRWMPELSGAIGGVTGKQAQEEAAKSDLHKIDYIITSGNAITLGYEGEEINFLTYPEDPSYLTVIDSEGNPLALTSIQGDHPEFQLQDSKYNWISFKPARDDSENNYIVLTTDGNDWPFLLSDAGVKYRAGTGHFIDLQKVPAVGWENNQQFGSGRGYIWSRTIPMIKDTMLLGHGADTYCIYFPHYDYVGKYNSGTFMSNRDIIVDKPHNMYFEAIIGTGGISMAALLALWGIYLVQSFLIYRKQNFSSYLSYVGAGIFFGVCGFLVSGIVNDSTVSVMPMFYGLLGTGIAINMLLKKKIYE